MRSLYTCLLVASLCIAPFCSGQNIDSALVLFYPFDGDALDYSGNQIDGTLSGPTFTDDRFGNPSRALQFNGTSAFLTADSSAVLDTLVAPITVTSWVRIDGWWNGSWAAIMSKSEPALTSLQYRIVVKSNGTYWLAPYPDCYQYQGSGNPPLSTWFYMTVSHDTDSISFFVDGVMTNTFACTTPISPNTHPLFLGKDPHGTMEYFNGVLDDFRIYDRALKADEVEVLYETATGMETVNAPASFSVSPNPATNSVSIRTKGTSPILSVELAEPTGRQVRSWSGGSISSELNLGNVPYGMYVMTLRTARQIYSQRIIVE